MTLNFGDLIVFSVGNILLFINDLVVDDPVGLITCEWFWIRKTRHLYSRVNRCSVFQTWSILILSR